MNCDPVKENWILFHLRMGKGEPGEKFTTFNPDLWRKLSEDRHIWIVGGGEVASLFLHTDSAGSVRSAHYGVGQRDDPCT